MFCTYTFSYIYYISYTKQKIYVNVFFLCFSFYLFILFLLMFILCLLFFVSHYCSQYPLLLPLWRFHDEEHSNLLNSMWLTAITFLCVGYGDIVPNTYCGRGITLTCGMVVSKFHTKTANARKTRETKKENLKWVKRMPNERLLPEKSTVAK